MAKPENNNELKGEINCEGCGGIAYVYENKRGHLYSNCSVCKCDQRRGEAMQAKFAAFVPVGTIEAERQAQAESSDLSSVAGDSAEPVASVPDAVESDDTSETASDHETTSKPRSKRPLLAVVAIGLGALLLNV